MKKKKKKINIIKEITDFIKDEWKFLLFCIVLTCVLLFPINYYITTGGGTININNRVKIENAYNSKGTFNISYVSQAKGCVLTYVLSYVMPNWEREKYSEYLIDEEDTIENMEYRDKLDLEYSNSNAIYWGYKLAGEDIDLKSSKIYVVYVFKEYKSSFKVKDELLSINDNSYDSISGYVDYINTLNEGEYVNVKVLRNKKEFNFTSKIHRYKDRNILGITLTNIREYNTSKKIKFKFKGNELGPSGGLMTTLDIYNKLTKKDLTYGLKIVGTGTIESDGSIGEIGGVKYKVLGAAKANADIFLVPKGNYKECMKMVKKKKLKIKVISVENIEDTINTLANLKG